MILGLGLGILVIVKTLIQQGWFKESFSQSSFFKTGIWTSHVVFWGNLGPSVGDACSKYCFLTEAFIQWWLYSFVKVASVLNWFILGFFTEKHALDETVVLASSSLLIVSSVCLAPTALELALLLLYIMQQLADTRALPSGQYVLRPPLSHVLCIVVWQTICSVHVECFWCPASVFPNFI